MTDSEDRISRREVLAITDQFASHVSRAIRALPAAQPNGTATLHNHEPIADKIADAILIYGHECGEFAKDPTHPFSRQRVAKALAELHLLIASHELAAQPATMPLKGREELIELIQREVVERLPDKMPGGKSIATYTAELILSRGIAQPRPEPICKTFATPPHDGSHWHEHPRPEPNEAELAEALVRGTHCHITYALRAAKIAIEWMRGK